MKRFFGVAVALLLLAGGSTAQAVSTPVPPQHSRIVASTAGGFVGDLQGDWSPQARAAWELAINAMNKNLQITVPVEVKITMESLPAETLGRGGSTGSKVNFPGAPIPDLWYPNSLANQFAGQRLSDGPDIEITMNSTLSWDFTGDPQKALKAGNPDFVTTITHEIIHGMGFLGTADAAGDEGKWGDDDGVQPLEDRANKLAGKRAVCITGCTKAASAVPAGTTSTKSATTVSYADIWDHFVIDGDGHSILDTGLFENPSTDLHDVLTSDNLFWGGERGRAANNGAPVKLFAPSPWSGGSSFMHLDDATYDGGPDAFMTSAGSNIPNIEIGPRVLGMLADMGWKVNR